MTRVLNQLDDVTAHQIADTRNELSDQARVRLRVPLPGVRHLLDSAGGYGQLSLPEATLELAPTDGASADRLLHAATQVAGTDLLVWARNQPLQGSSNDPLVAALLARRARPERTLWQLRRTGGPVPERPLPAGFAVRGFEVGQDEQPWLQVNAAAFADHPEQSAMTLADLRARQAEPWFDPKGFLLAERDGELLGFHWTKVHAGPPPVGEVYVLGVAPAAQGTGLGSALFAAGLQLLADRGLSEFMLYVDDDNRGALTMYERAGFRKSRVDVEYLLPA